MSDICELSELPADQCACRIHNPDANRIERRRVVLANFTGRCKKCGEDINLGDRITRGQYGYVHEECV